jgi:hypothetical protein
MSSFDAIKATKEELAGLSDVHKLVMTRARETDRRLAEAEADHSAFLKMEAFMRQLLDDKRSKLQALESEAMRKAKAAATEPPTEERPTP